MSLKQAITQALEFDPQNRDANLRKEFYDGEFRAFMDTAYDYLQAAKKHICGQYGISLRSKCIQGTFEPDVVNYEDTVELMVEIPEDETKPGLAEGDERQFICIMKVLSRSDRLPENDSWNEQPLVEVFMGAGGHGSKRHITLSEAKDFFLEKLKVFLSPDELAAVQNAVVPREAPKPGRRVLSFT